MKRTIKKQFWLNREEAELLKKKSKKACLTEAALVRFLIRGYEPKEKPDEDFYDAMNRISVFANQIEQLAGRVRDDEVAVNMLGKEIKRWHRFQADIEKRFLEPEERRAAWQ